MNGTDMCHIMIDIETLSNKSNAVILSIGAVQFDLKGNTLDRFHRGIEIQSCLDCGLRLDGDTIEWWLKQSRKTIDRVMSLKKACLPNVLSELELCFALGDMNNTYVWSHGSNFDLVVLENAYHAVGRKVWWKYKNVRDTRTLFDLVNYKYVAKGGHDALEDAREQAKAVVEAYQKLNQRTDIANKIQFLLDRYVKTEDGKFCFPDGDIWDVGKGGTIRG